VLILSRGFQIVSPWRFMSKAAEAQAIQKVSV
jgi:hypothetical protein